MKTNCAECNVLADGKNSHTLDDGSLRCFLEENSGDVFVPRKQSVDIDVALNVIDDARNGNLSNSFYPEFLLNGKEDAVNNFACGHYTVGKETIDEVNDRMRKLVDSCDNVQGFAVYHRIAGGAGSALGHQC